MSLVSAALRTHFVANQALTLRQTLAGDDKDGDIDYDDDDGNNDCYVYDGDDEDHFDKVDHATNIL